MNRKVLITGGAGFIGSHTTDALLDRGCDVLVVDNFRTGRWENLAGAMRRPEFKLVELDVADEVPFVELVGRAKPSVIIHLAALVSVQESMANPELNLRLNYETTRVVAAAAARHSVPRVVFASTAAVYGHPEACPVSEDARKQPLSPYGEAKLRSEHLLLQESRVHGYTVRCQRYFNVYGPRQDPRSPYSGVISIFLDHLKRGQQPTIYGDGTQTRDFIYVADIARANAQAALLSPMESGVANICTGESASINGLWALMSAGRPSLASPNYGSARSGEIQHSCGLPHAARGSLNFSAAIGLAEGLERLQAGAA